MDVTPSQRRVCPNCGEEDTLRVDRKRGEVFCETCSAVVEDALYERSRPPYDPADNNDDRHHGPPTSLAWHDKGLTTEIDGDNSGEYLSGKHSDRVQRMRNLHGRTKTEGTRDRNLRDGLGEIKAICSSIEVSDDVHKQACKLFRQAVENDALIGRDYECVAATTVALALRQIGKPRRVKEIAETSSATEQQLFSTTRKLARELGVFTVPQTPEEYLPRVCSDLEEEIPKDVRDGARRLIECGHDGGITGDPQGLAGAAIYVAEQEAGEARVTQAEIAESAEVSDVTIYQRASDYREHVSAL